jgi:hypothetical protein
MPFEILTVATPPIYSITVTNFDSAERPVLVFGSKLVGAMSLIVGHWLVVR